MGVASLASESWNLKHEAFFVASFSPFLLSPCGSRQPVAQLVWPFLSVELMKPLLSFVRCMYVCFVLSCLVLCRLLVLSGCAQTGVPSHQCEPEWQVEGKKKKKTKAQLKRVSSLLQLMLLLLFLFLFLLLVQSRPCPRCSSCT